VRLEAELLGDRRRRLQRAGERARIERVELFVRQSIGREPRLLMPEIGQVGGVGGPLVGLPVGLGMANQQNVHARCSSGCGAGPADCGEGEKVAAASRLGKTAAAC